MRKRRDILPKTAVAFCFAMAIAWCCMLLPDPACATSDDSSIGKILAEAMFTIDTEKPSEAIDDADNPTNAEDTSTESGESSKRQNESGETQEEASLPEVPPEMTADIMGEGIIPADAMVALFQQSGYPYPSDVYANAGAPTIEDFVDLCVEEASAEGVRPEVLFAQIIHETGWLQFGGQVSPDQNNFGGLGATNDGAAGASFDDVRMGLRAQVQHLKAYACTDELANPVVDPRFDLVSRGCAPTVYDLGGRWAYPGDTYGDALMARMQDMYAIAYQ